MADHDAIRPAVIWLSPFCEGCEKHCGSAPEDGQVWCTEPQDDCPECGLGWTRYVIDSGEARRGVLIKRRAAIGDYLGLDEREVDHQVVTNGLPVFHLGRCVVAKAASLDSWVNTQESRSRVLAPAPEPLPAPMRRRRRRG